MKAFAILISTWQHCRLELIFAIQLYNLENCLLVDEIVFDIWEKVRQLSWSYNGLWIMLIKQGIKKTELKEIVGLNSTTIAKMGKNQAITMDSLEKLCKAFKCRIEDIVEYIPDSNE